MPPTVLYHPSSLLIPGKKKSGNQVLEEVPPCPGLGHLAIPGPVSKVREMEYTGHMCIICPLLVPAAEVNPTQMTLPKE